MAEIDLIAVGDVILDPDNHDRAFAHVKHVMRDADITVVNCDQVYSDLGDSPSGFWPIYSSAPPRSAAMLDTLADAGVDLISFGNNHSMDWGYEAMFDCIERCRERGIATVGFGRNLVQAREPTIIERNGTRFGFLAYCCVGPPGYDATGDRPGHAPVRIHTHYEQWDPQPGTPPLIRTFAERGDLRNMVGDIERLRERVDVVVPIYHWGVHYIPELIADYQFEVGHAAVDAGADLIVGAHAHLPKGVEVYKGRVVFHGMNDFACAGAWSSPASQPGCRYPESSTWDWTRHGALLRERFGEVPDEITRPSMIARATVDAGAVSRVAYLPCDLDDERAPEIVGPDDERGAKVFEYFRAISRSQGLDTEFRWDGGEVVIAT